jgi:hypothetical protein
MVKEVRAVYIDNCFLRTTYLEALHVYTLRAPLLTNFSGPDDIKRSA